MPTEFISLAFPNASTELEPIPGAPIDPAYLKRYAQNLDDYGFNYTLQPYDSSYFDPFTTGATIAAHTKNLKVIIALRPNTVYPTVAAKSLATLDQLSNGRAVARRDIETYAGAPTRPVPTSKSPLGREPTWGRERVKVVGLPLRRREGYGRWLGETWRIDVKDWVTNKWMSSLLERVSSARKRGVEWSCGGHGGQKMGRREGVSREVERTVGRVDGTVEQQSARLTVRGFDSDWRHLYLTCRLQPK